jgi:chorismate mutase/prephenate dehydratase
VVIWLKIAFLGPTGTFTEEAAKKIFGEAAELAACASIPEVFEKVEVGEADSGVVPVENSTEGSVNLTFDCLLKTRAFVTAETSLRIVQNIFRSRESAAKAKGEANRIFSHPQSLAQCRNYLKSNCPKAKLEECASNAKAGEIAAMEKCWAIGPLALGGIYGLELVENGIEDNKNNFTRFLAVSMKEEKPESAEKTSIVFSVPHTPGSLVAILMEFSERQVNLTKIESRPLRGAVWEYVFFVDLEGKKGTKRFDEALGAAKGKCLFLKDLGSYRTVV